MSVPLLLIQLCLAIYFFPLTLLFIVLLCEFIWGLIKNLYLFAVYITELIRTNLMFCMVFITLYILYLHIKLGDIDIIF